MKIAKKVLNVLKGYYFKSIKYLSKLLRGISNNLDRKLNKDFFIQNSLSPKLLIDEELSRIEPYIERINDGVRNPTIKNIALMGSYGSGKSTIIKNFEFLHPEYKVLNLSLGSYSKKEIKKKDGKIIPEEEQNEILDDLNERLENSLVKQMIYREKNSKLPYSRFKKINRISRQRMVSLFMVFFSLSISFLYLKNFLSLKDILSNNIGFIKANSDSMDLLFYSIFFISSCIILFQIFQIVVRQFKLSKLNFANVSIEGIENNYSYFNKYIDEILYYFETNKFDVVVIEDVDRFKRIKVFEHLKELNILLNNSKQINRNITFVYAVKEDIFSKSEEDIEEHESEIRTKFFELIIPIIPVVDIFNSRDYLVPMMKEKSENEFEEGFITFLRDISLYIKDLRLLTNIVNEYFTYLDIHKSLSGSMNQESLFSIIALKNLVPSVFTDLQKSQGFVYEILVQRKYDNDLIEDEENIVEQNRNEIQAINEQIKVDKLSETKKYFFEQGVSTQDRILINGSYEELSGLNMRIIDAILESSDENIYFARSNGSTPSISKSNFIKKIKEQDSILNNRNIKKQEELDLKKNELDSFYRLSLQQKIKKYPELIELISNPKDNNYTDDNDFILYVLSNGYVAEDYSTYLSLFYEKSMTIDDKNLLVKLKSNQKIDFEEKIDNVKEFIKELLPQDYEKQGIVNINILIYLFSMEYIDKYKIRNAVLEMIFKLLEDLDIILTKDKSEIVILIFELLRKNNYGFVNRFGVERRNKLVNLIFYACLGDISFYYNKDERENVLWDALNLIDNEYDDFGNEIYDDVYLVKENILSRPNFFLEIEEYVDSDIVMEKLYSHNNKYEGSYELTIYFQEVDLENFSQEQFDDFIRYELYEFEPSIFSEILNYNNKTEKKEVSYQNILNSGMEDLIDTIKSNLKHFALKILLRLDNLSETEFSFLELLNSDKLDLESLKLRLITKSNIIIKELKQVKDTSLWKIILDKRKCNITWENLKEFYEIENMNLDGMKSIFNNKNEIISLKNQYDSCNSKDKIKDFLKKLVDDRVIDITKNNIELLKVTSYDAGNLSSEAIQILATNNLIDFNLDNMNKFKKYGVFIDIMLNNPDDFLKNYVNLDLSEEDVITLIKKWNIESAKELLSVVVDTEADEFFQNDELVDILFERKISSDEKLFEKLLKNTDKSHLKKYFIFNLQESTLSNSMIENTLNLFYMDNIADFSFEEYDCIFGNFSNNDLFVKLLNGIFNSKRLDVSFIDKLSFWLPKQDKPISELYIDKNGKNRVVHLENSLENKELIKNLKRFHIVSTFKEKDGNLLEVNMKRKLPERLKEELL
ncbi:hypothetical protein [Enterococcus plantarum]|uniref:YobI family P-loop NTPase n=1 Tax=Enterococcus plantarum TaxID=1077675 RepID=UPI0030F8C1B8